MEKEKISKQYDGDEKLLSAFEMIQIMNVEQHHKLVLDQMKKLNLKSKKDTTPISPKRQKSKPKI